MTEQVACNFTCTCGRNAVMQVGKLNLCEECAKANLEGDGPAPRPRFQDVVTPDRPVGDEIL
jgi:hypothetical protein